MVNFLLSLDFLYSIIFSILYYSNAELFMFMLIILYLSSLALSVADRFMTIFQVFSIFCISFFSRFSFILIYRLYLGTINI